MDKTWRTSWFRKLARRRKKQQLLKQERIKKNGVTENKEVLKRQWIELNAIRKMTKNIP